VNAFVEGKSLLKRVLGIPDPYGNFRRFKGRVHPRTLTRRDEIFAWAEAQVQDLARRESPEAYEASPDPLVRRGWELRGQALVAFRNKCAGFGDLRVLVHTPPVSVSPAGASLFDNLVQTLEYMGIPSRVLQWDESLSVVLESFAPTVLMTSDHPLYLERLGWEALAAWRRERPLLLGLTASPSGEGLAPLAERLAWAGAHEVAFYYTFHSAEDVLCKGEYSPFRDVGEGVIPVEFGANILQYYPVPGVVRDLDYVFLASSNRRKWSRYIGWLGDILSRESGFLDGPGWEFDGRTIMGSLPQDAQRYVYARARVGLNLHLESQIKGVGELNERTYQLAACGVPQLVDNAALLPARFRAQGLYVASDPRQYAAHFKTILSQPEEAAGRALEAMDDVYRSHTLFHRAEGLVLRLWRLLQ